MARPRSLPRSAMRSGTGSRALPPATMPIGKSRSPSASSSPRPRAADAVMAERMPPITGPAILSKVHTAATPITPAPKKRTSWRKMVVAHSSVPTGNGCCAVRIGSRIHQPVASPTNCAMPTDSPTRCPTPNKAKLKPAGDAGRARTGTEPQRRFRRRQLHLRQDREARRHQRALDQHVQPGRALRAALARLRHRPAALRPPRGPPG